MCFIVLCCVQSACFLSSEFITTIRTNNVFQFFFIKAQSGKLDMRLQLSGASPRTWKFRLKAHTKCSAKLPRSPHATNYTGFRRIFGILVRRWIHKYFSLWLIDSLHIYSTSHWILTISMLRTRSMRGSQLISVLGTIQTIFYANTASLTNFINVF